MDIMVKGRLAFMKNLVRHVIYSERRVYLWQTIQSIYVLNICLLPEMLPVLQMVFGYGQGFHVHDLQTKTLATSIMLICPNSLTNVENSAQ